MDNKDICKTIKETAKEIKTSTEKLNEVSKQPTSDEELDISSEHFNPLRALYAPNFRISKHEPKVEYQNMAAFESAFKRFGIWRLNEINTNPSTSKQRQEKDGLKTEEILKKERTLILEEIQQRRFETYQMPVKGKPIAERFSRNLLKQMETMKGPLAQLYQFLQNKQKVYVLVRKEHGIRGHMTGTLVCFDKHWNLLLENVYEVWQRRKFKYGDNKMLGEPQDCTKQLKKLGIELPKQNVKSLNRKNVEISRHLSGLMIRGEQVVLVRAAL